MCLLNQWDILSKEDNLGVVHRWTSCLPLFPVYMPSSDNHSLTPAPYSVHKCETDIRLLISCLIYESAYIKQIIILPKTLNYSFDIWK